MSNRVVATLSALALILMAGCDFADNAPDNAVEICATIEDDQLKADCIESVFEDRP